MGNQLSTGKQCPSCHASVIQQPDSNLLCYIDSKLPIYCSKSCQIDYRSNHWTYLLKYTDRDLFNKVLAHLAGIRFENGSKNRKKNTCILDEITKSCHLCDEVYKWICIRAEQDDIAAQHSLGYCYSIGYCVPQSDVEAAKWFGKAVAGGYQPSLISLQAIFKKLEIVYGASPDSSLDTSSIVSEDPS
jgi:hypothetical protein